jgi:heme-degrading monooxygenase HmoA
MFSVLFEVRPRADGWDSYLDLAKALRPELEKVDGFIDNIRYRSLTREGWILSLSGWRDEKALVRWRTHARHHDVQFQGRDRVLADYHLRVGQITDDTRVPDGYTVTEQRLDETQTGQATAVILIDSTRPSEGVTDHGIEEIARHLGLDTTAAGLADWDVYEGVLAPDDLMLMTSWRTRADADAFDETPPSPANARRRRIRIVRDYAMFDRRENPQYYPDVPDRR